MKIKILVECPEIADVVSAIRDKFPTKVGSGHSISVDNGIFSFFVKDTKENYLNETLSHYLTCFANNMQEELIDEFGNEPNGLLKEFFEGIVETFPEAVSIELRPGSLTDVIVVEENQE